MKELDDLKGKSLPSLKHGAWIVDSVCSTPEGRCRLVTGNLMGEQWVYGWQLLQYFKELTQKEKEEK